MKKLSALYFILISFTGLKAQDAAFYQKFFPDPSYAMPVPIKKGDTSFNYYTQYKEVVQFIKDQAARHPELIKIGSIGETQRGRDQISVLLTNQKTDNTNKLRVTIIGCVHGNEPIATDGLLFLIYRLTEETQYADLLNHLEILVCLMSMRTAANQTKERPVTESI